MTLEETLAQLESLGSEKVRAQNSKNGALTLMVINLSDSEQRVPLQVKGIELTDAEVWRLDATHFAENLGMQTLSTDGTVLLPSQSATLYVIR